MKPVPCSICGRVHLGPCRSNRLALAAIVLALAACNQPSGSRDLQRWEELGAPNKLHTTRHTHNELACDDAAEEKAEEIQSSIPKIKDKDFDLAISDNAAVVEFYADWCGSCRAFAPVVDRLAKRHPHVKFYRVNVDESPLATSKSSIAIVPTLVLFHHSIRSGSLVGAYSDDVLDRFVEGDGI